MDARTTRLARSATTFGVVGRVAITVAVLAPAPIWFVTINSAFFPLGLWGLLSHTVIATFVLKSAWRPVPIEEAEAVPRFLSSIRDRQSREPGRLGRPVRLPRSVGIAFGVGVAGLGAFLVSRAGEGFHEYAIAAAVLVIPVALLLAWLSGQ
jgi:hypothetical protein